MMNTKILSLLLSYCLLGFVVSQTVISNCTFLQGNLTFNDLSVSYILDQDIDCSGINPFIPLANTTTPFKGMLNGNGFKIKNVNISDGGNYIGIFRSIDSGKVQNLTLQDVNITATGAGTSMGALFGFGNNITVQDVHLVTSATAQNLIQATSGASFDFVGGVAGLVRYGNFTRVSVTNTTVDVLSGFYTGGLLNVERNLNNVFSGSFLFNYGYPANPSQMIVRGNNTVGGVFGTASGQGFDGNSVTNSGTLRGKVASSSSGSRFLGGFCGSSVSTNFDSIFVRPDVTVTDSFGSSLSCGGVFGSWSCPGTIINKFTISNTYSRASSVQCTNNVGGSLGTFTLNSNANLTLNNIYASTNVSGTTNVRPLIGFPNINSGNAIASNNFYDSAFGNDTYGTGVVCVFFSVNATFPNNVWGTDRLRIEPNFTPGVCTCATGCTPTTAAPTTAAPTTAAPIVDFSGVYNVDATCSNSQKCCCPTGKVSITRQSNSVTVSISQVTGNCTTTGAQTVSFALTSSTSGTGTFNGLNYTFTYSNQKFTLSSPDGCSTDAKCESGNCRSQPSGASMVSASLVVIFSLLVFFFF